MKSSQILLKAAKLLETKGWCKTWYALDKDGNSCDVTDSEASRFCMLGAVYNVTQTQCVGAGSAVSYIHKVLSGKTTYVSNWNDEQKRKRPVISALRKASKLALNVGD